MAFGVILSSFLAALGQLGDRRLLRVMGLGIGLSVLILIGAWLMLALLIGWIVPPDTTVPIEGESLSLRLLLSLGAGAAVLVLSIFLMVPIAALISGLFLDRVADAVEDRHYPALPPATPPGRYESMIMAVNFAGVMIGANLLALILYLLAGPFGPLVFWAINGALIGRDYFQQVALRRLPADQVRALRRTHRGTIWIAGALLAAPLSVPFVNLAMPVVGMATFTHLFHRLTRTNPRG